MLCRLDLDAFETRSTRAATPEPEAFFFSLALKESSIHRYVKSMILGKGLFNFDNWIGFDIECWMR